MNDDDDEIVQADDEDEDEFEEDDNDDDEDEACSGDVSFNMTGKEDPDFSPDIESIKKAAASQPVRRSSRLPLFFCVIKLLKFLKLALGLLLFKKNFCCKGLEYC